MNDLLDQKGGWRMMFAKKQPHVVNDSERPWLVCVIDKQTKHVLRIQISFDELSIDSGNL
jgi:hypothetical protein